MNFVSYKFYIKHIVITPVKRWVTRITLNIFTLGLNFCNMSGIHFDSAEQFQETRIDKDHGTKETTHSRWLCVQASEDPRSDPGCMCSTMPFPDFMGVGGWRARLQ